MSSATLKMLQMHWIDVYNSSWALAQARAGCRQESATCIIASGRRQFVIASNVVHIDPCRADVRVEMRSISLQVKVYPVEGTKVQKCSVRKEYPEVTCPTAARASVGAWWKRQAQIMRLVAPMWGSFIPFCT